MVVSIYLARCLHLSFSCHHTAISAMQKSKHTYSVYSYSYILLLTEQSELLSITWWSLGCFGSQHCTFLLGKLAASNFSYYHPHLLHSSYKPYWSAAIDENPSEVTQTLRRHQAHDTATSYIYYSFSIGWFCRRYYDNNLWGKVQHLTSYILYL